MKPRVPGRHIALSVVFALITISTAYPVDPLPVTTTNDLWPTMNSINSMKSEISDYKSIKDTNDAINKGVKTADTLNKGAKASDDFAKFIQSYEGLSSSDGQAMPNYNPPGGPQVPIHCLQGAGGECQSCYAPAVDGLNTVRARFERLRALRYSTEEFYKASLSFGDDVSSIHGVAGLGWQNERRKIEATWKTFQGSYKAKHQELVAALQKSLKEFEGCESKYFNNPDWYNRFGYIYYSFMESRYAW